MSARVGVHIWIFWLKAALRQLIFKKLRHKTMRNNILRDEMKNFLKVCVFCITIKIYVVLMQNTLSKCIPDICMTSRVSD